MEKIIKKGLTYLNSLSVLPQETEVCKIDLIKIADNLTSDHDVFSWLSVIQSLIASSKNTFGVGAVIVDMNGEVIVEGHNQVFNPYFRSDLHAEMVVLTALEDIRKSDQPPINYTLYTSLEPCMMCLGRSIFSRIGHLYFVAKDLHGGVINNAHIPFTFANLMEQQVIKEANCPLSLKNISSKIVAFSVQKLIDKLGGTIDVMRAH
jgi:tRNA(Arg) A34 adenosine deaminase TadA